MNPWWLRPPAEEAPAKGKKPKKPVAEPQKDKKPEPKEKQAAPSERRSSRGRGPKRRRSSSGRSQPKASSQRRIAVFFDVEDISRGLESADNQDLDLDLVLQRLAEKGQIVAKRAYGDVQRYGDQEARIRAADLEIVEVPRHDGAGKAASNMKLAVDAIELCYSSEPCEVFVLISGDGGFVPLVAKLREAKAEVLGLGVRGSVSSDLEKGCDDFLFHDAIAPAQTPPPASDAIDKSKEPIFALLVETIESMETGSEGIIWGSTLKQEMRRRDPGLDVAGLGYATFTDLLEDAERHEVIHLERDDRSGGYYVAGLARQ